MRIELRIDPRNMVGLLKHTPEVIGAALNSATRNLGKAIVDDQVRTNMRGRPGIKDRSGRLRAARFATLDTGTNTRTLVCGFGGIPYARINELGGTIVPVKKQWLTIPIGPAVLPSGIARGRATMFDLEFRLGRKPGTAYLGKSLVEMSSTAPRGAIKGRAFTPSDYKKSFQIWFVLKKSVTIPPRLGFYALWRSWFISGRAGKGINIEIARQVRRLNGGARSASQ